MNGKLSSSWTDELVSKTHASVQVMPDGKLLISDLRSKDGTYRKEAPDAAMTSTKGGIDFKSDKMNLDVKNAGEAIKFKITPEQLLQLQNAPGFVPVIINVQPLKDLPLFLGLDAQPQKSASQTAAL